MSCVNYKLEKDLELPGRRASGSIWGIVLITLTEVGRLEKARNKSPALTCMHPLFAA